MTDVLDLCPPRRTTKRFLGSAALLEAIEIEQLIVVPGLNALLAQPSRFGLAGETSAALAATLRAHVRTVAQLKAMALEVLGETRCSAAHMNKMPSSLPVRGLATIMAHPRRAEDPDVRAIVSIGFALVAVHAVTDPTNCTTASPALNLVPPPLHRDRALLGRVLAQALPRLDPDSAMLLTLYVTKASAFFAAAERRRAGTEEFSLVRYNSHALRTSCRRIGLRTHQLRIALP
ncbi:hypothetical protein [Gordonia sp. ABSL49_1]|uniref:hypothetical protein n=1 Tax=Gordonia sp. ABSL49_1 TaxID=2920941 RepID=UPI001F0D5043|nr:hypothetical protein [Gordonia sp. ABSL49_1]MCH5644229.1 hypothetical protein [Gordonia sp. ABSL49_1]